ncbi:MAG: HlyD family efflux transporter periplasmic adaptor subunit [Pirellulaceae bacterium]|nr:HlyD family efflux transporter periplasmic adaptor subunit [Pirellulaceae bacterium]
MTAGVSISGKASLPAMKLVQSSRAARRWANVLLVLLLAAVAAMAFVPWQQSARGTGKVAAYVPQERQQTILSPVKGVVSQIGEGLVEGARVRRGDFILSIEPTAANLVDQLRGQVRDLEAKLETSRVKSEVYGRNVVDFQAARDAAVQAADELVEAAKAKWEAKQKLVRGYEAKELQARLNFERQKGLFEKGVTAEKELEKLQKDWDVAQSDFESAQLEVAAAKGEWDAKISEREQKLRDANTKVDYARAMQQDALGMVATAEKEIRDVQIKLAELDRLTITAPRDGTIFRMPIYERGQALKEGDPLFTIVPDTTERAVELWVSGNDTPLVRVGDHVRLQFEGWPAVQFAGWPSVAVGTFGGQVVSIDPTDDGTGKFRLLVKHDGDIPWPSNRFLRQGVRANGWVMLSQVPLGYELWRQLNGFPPVISKDEPESDKTDSKKKVPLPK